MNELGKKGQDPKTYFNLKYSSRKDLGNTGGDDGYNYRGFGPIQLTGRANFKKYAEMINEPDLYLNPENYRDMSNPRNVEVAIKVSIAFWNDRGLNKLAEEGGLNEKTLEKISKKVNGGLNGYEDRKKRYEAL
jgi:putative chitinase